MGVGPTPLHGAPGLEGPTLCCLGILNNFFTETPHFHFAPGLANSVNEISELLYVTTSLIKPWKVSSPRNALLPLSSQRPLVATAGPTASLSERSQME